MGLFGSRMSDEQLAAAKGKGQTANELNTLATKANGFGVSRQDARKADADLVKQVGRRTADRLKEDAVQRAGGAAKGLRKWFG